MKRHFKLTVGNFIFVRSGTYNIPEFDMDKIFIKTIGYDICRIYNHKNDAIAVIRLDTLHPDGHFFLRSHLSPKTETPLKRLIFVFYPRLSKFKIVNYLVQFLFRKKPTISVLTANFTNCTAEVI